MDKFVNAARLLDKLDADIKMFDDCHTWESSAISYMKRSINEVVERDGEFRQVVHAHWIDVGGNSICSECRCRSIEDEEGWFCNEKSPVFCPYCGAIMDEEVE